MFVAVETSDIVASTELSESLRKEVIAAIKSRYAQMLTNTSSQFDFFRGDAYQVLYADPECALKQALLTKLYLLAFLAKPIQITQSLAVGKTQNITINMGENMDEVFVRSGRNLDELQSAYLHLYCDEFSDDFSLVMACMNRFLSNITRKQAEMLYWWLLWDFPEHKKIAEHLNVSRQNINTHLLRANADLFKALLDQYSKHIQGLVKQ